MTAQQLVIRPIKKERNMSILKNPVQAFMRNFIRLVVFVPLWLIFALGNFTRAFSGFGASVATQFLYGGIKTLVILWIANITAGMLYILPQWERLVLLRLGKSVGTRGPGMFIIPPFIYSVASTRSWHFPTPTK